MANEVSINVTSKDRTKQGFDSARKRAEGLRESTRRVGEVAGGVVASGVFENIASAARRAFTDSIRAASDLEQAVGGTQGVFGDAADVIANFADRASDAVGLSEREFREMTTLIGGQLKRMTGDVELAADESIRLTQVAADLAAMYGGTTKQAVEALGSAFRGEADPAERFNLNLKQGQVNAKAVEMGLAATTSEVDENARAQATLALITEQSSDALGTFADESDTAAGAQQRASAAAEDAKAAFGEVLTPAVAAAASVATDMLEGFQALPGPLQAVVAVLSAAAALAPGVMALKAALDALSVSIRGVLLAAGPATAVLAGLGTILATVGSASGEAETSQRDLLAVIRDVNDASGEQRREMAASEIQQMAVKDAADELGVELSDLTDIMLGDSEALEQLRERMQRLVDEGTTEMQAAQGQTRKTMSEEAKQAEVLVEWLDNLQGAQEQTAEKENELAEAVGMTSEKIAEQGEETAKVTKQMADSWVESVESMTDAGDVYSQMLDDLEEDEQASLEAYLEQMQKRVEAAQSHNENVTKVTNKASEDVREILRQDAIENPELAQMMASATDEEWAQLEQFARQRMQNASNAMQNALETDIPVMERIAENAGQAVAEGIARKIREGKELTVGETRAIMNEVETEAEAREIIPSIDPLLNERAREIVNNRLDELAEDRVVTYHPQGLIPGGRGHAAGGVVGGGYASGGVVGGAAAGGPRGSDITVNDGLQPEAIRVPDGSMVVPSVDQATDRNQLAAAGGGDGVTINLYVQGSIRSDRDLIEMIRDEMLNGGFRGALEGAGA